MDWDDVKLFLAVAREGQMLGAAHRMGTSQPRLSRRIAALEVEIGVRLLDRTTRGSSLTEEGKSFFESAERMEAEMMSGLAQLQGRGSEVRGTIRIGTPDGFGSAFLASRLHRLTACHPELRIQLVPIGRGFSLSQREADLAVMVGRPTHGRLRAKRLTDYTLGCYAAPDYLARHGTPESAEALRSHDLVGYVEDLIPFADLTYSLEIRSDWKAGLEIASPVGQVEAVRSGAGIGVLHDFMAAGDPQLRRILPARVVTRSYTLVWHENMRVAQRVRAAAEFIETEVSTAQGLFVRS